MVHIKGLQAMSQQECNARHRTEQQNGGDRRLQLLKEAGARVLAAGMAPQMPPELPPEASDWQELQAARDASYLQYLAGGMDPRD